MTDYGSQFPDLLRRAFAVAFRILGSEALAEAAAIEALARAHASWSKVGKLSYRDAWISRAAANEAIGLARRRDPSTGDDGVAPLRIALVTALRSLPRRQRDVVILGRLEGFSEAEVARCLRVSSADVKSNATLANESLQELLGKNWAEEVSRRDLGGA